MHPRRDEAISMRKAGASFLEIKQALGIGKGTLSYMLKGVKLNAKQKKNLLQKQRDGQAQLMNALAQMSPEDRTAIARRGGRNCQELHGARVQANLVNEEVGSLSYRQDELPIKATLEKIYRRRFHKERIGNRYVDFACKDLIIEFTTDGTHGLFDLIRRMEDVSSDPRRKIAYVDTPRVGPKSAARLERAVDSVLDYRDV